MPIRTSIHAGCLFLVQRGIQGNSPRELPSDTDTRRRLCGILQDLGLDIADTASYRTSTTKSPAAFPGSQSYESCTSEPPWERGNPQALKKLLHCCPSVLASLDDGSLMMADDRTGGFLHPHALRYLIASLCQS